MTHSSASPVLRPGSPSEPTTASSATPKPVLLDESPGEWLAYGPSGSVRDDAERKRQIRLVLDQGMAEVRAGVGADLDTVRRQTDKLLASHRK